MKFTRIDSGRYFTDYKDFNITLIKESGSWNATVHLHEKSHQLKPTNLKLESVALAEEFCNDPQCFLLLDVSKNFENLNYEETEAFFVAPEYTNIVSPYKIKRVQKGSERYYCTYSDAEPKFYLSVTSFSSKMLPNPFLGKWRGDLGNQLADFKADLAAEYGTFMHIEIGDFIKTGTYDFETVDARVVEHLLFRELSMKLVSEWVSKIHNDMLSFAQFCIEKEVRTIACEFPIVSDEWGLGGCIDYPCSFMFGKKRVNAIIDFKSGRKGFFEAHELQLKCYRDMWNESFGDILPITHIFNWAPTDWRCGVPKYKLKNQSNGKIRHEFLMQRGLAEGYGEPSDIKRGVGVVEFGQSCIKENVSIITLSNYIKAKNLR